MTQLSKDTINVMANAVKTAKLFDIESFIIEPDKIRGINEARTVAIFNKDLDIDIEYPMGINRLDVLVNRIALFEGCQDSIIDCVIDSRINEVHTLVFKANKLKAEYKCAKIKAIEAPKSISVPNEYRLDINADAINMLIRADVAMRGETFNILCNDNVVTYGFVDSNSDVFRYESNNQIINLMDDTPVNISYKYPVKLVLLALKNNTTGYLYITQKGMLTTEINGICVYIPSKAQD